MKKLVGFSLALACLFTAGSAFGQAGVFAATIDIKANGGADAWYPLVSQANNGPGLFPGANLGTFNIGIGQTLVLAGAEGLIYKNVNGGTDVTGVTLDYRIYPTSGTPGPFLLAQRDYTTGSGTGTGSVTDANGNVFSPGSGYANQKWANNPIGSSIPLNLLSGLSNGTYTVEVFFQAATNGVNTGNPVFLNNGGLNYKAAFAVIPEPSTLSLLAGPTLLGAWFFVRRRRS